MPYACIYLTEFIKVHDQTPSKTQLMDQTREEKERGMEYCHSRSMEYRDGILVIVIKSRQGPNGQAVMWGVGRYWGPALFSAAHA